MSLRWDGTGPKPGSWLLGSLRAETSTLGRGHGLEPVYHLGRDRPIPIEDMMIIQALQRTAAAVYGFAINKLRAVAAAAELGR